MRVCVCAYASCNPNLKNNIFDKYMSYIVSHSLIFLFQCTRLCLLMVQPSPSPSHVPPLPFPITSRDLSLLTQGVPYYLCHR